MPSTTDRGDIVHFAGFHRLSPALDGRSMPAFSAVAGDGLTRCGWASFFAAMASRDLALAYDPADGTSARFLPAAEAPRGPRPGLADALQHARRFWRALFPAKRAPGQSTP
jgi:hypothetical protein